MKDSPLLADLYQLNMIQAYLTHGDTEIASFESFIRRPPPRRGFLLAAGLAQLLDFLEQLRFSTEEIDWLARTGRFDRQLLDYLASFRFTGDEPILRITTPLPQAQLIEPRLINILRFQGSIYGVRDEADGGMTVSPDGTHVVLSSTLTDESDLHLVEFR